MFLRSANRMSCALACLLALLLAPLLPACKSSTDSAQPAAPWKHTSEEARYQITIPSTWNREDQPKTLNSYADLAANLENSLFLIVIPQKLPTFPVPDARAVKSAGMELMQQNIANMQLKRQGDILLDGVSGVSIFFEGTVESERIQYIATYMTHAGWGYQIIAWGPNTAERRLIEEVDQLLAGWKFLDREHLATAKSQPKPAEASAEPQPDSKEQQILDSLDNIVEHPESTDSFFDDDDENNENNEAGENEINQKQQ